MTFALRPVLSVARCFNTQVLMGASLLNSPEVSRVGMITSQISRGRFSEVSAHRIYSTFQTDRSVELLKFGKLTSLEKAELLLRTMLTEYIGHGQPVTNPEFKELFEGLRSLGKFTSSNSYQNLLELAAEKSRPLFKETQLEQYHPSAYIRNYTDLEWALRPDHLIPLSYEGSPQKHEIVISEKLQKNPTVEYLLKCTQEDAMMAWTLATPFIDEKTLVYEYGCWNGGNLLGLLFFALEMGVHPGACVGTDINKAALNIAQAASSIFSFHPPKIQFRLSNALDLHLINLDQLRCLEPLSRKRERFLLHSSLKLGQLHRLLTDAPAAILTYTALGYRALGESICKRRN